MANALLEARTLTKRFPVAGRADVEVFAGLDFSLDEGELATLFGPSGTGKSTLLHLLGTLDRPTSGEIFIEGKNVANLNDRDLSNFRNRRIGFIFQFHHLLPEFTALENVAMPALIAGQSFDQVRERATELLTDVGLAERTEHRPSMLSGGESQRVAVARAFLMHPALILADEPTGNLDTRNSEILFNIIVNLSRKHRQTFLIATHNLDLAKQADRVFHLENGRLSEEK
ncbi:MAG TPA: ABC transporter ATP-binding protein [Candidatus Kapabacteria bacterium]|jgi:lipoprotein-releasing system ATP-binding protein|nr:ABC transporter ATP-binding protein [Candidatus Kapabacteria bacterium]